MSNPREIAHSISPFTAIAAAIGILCSAPTHAANCDSTSKSLIPLTELTGDYQGYPGGLYPGGMNVPPAFHDSVGRVLANSFEPLDTLGQVDTTAGVWVLLSVGMSNTTQEFSRFIQDLQADTTPHPHLRIVDGAQGGQTAARIKYDTANFWRVIESRLRTQGLGTLQVQAIWLKEANAGPSGGFPSATRQLRDDLRDVVRTAHGKYPNLKQIFFSSRTYGGYASTSLNPEPYAYESGFAARWVIEAQLAGNDSLNHLPDSGAVNAPWLAWGPYLWGDGIIPRAADGLQWFCADFTPSDGTHPSDLGRAKVSDLLELFFKSSPYTVPWFLKPSAPICNCSCHGDPVCDGVRSDVLDVVEGVAVAFRGQPSTIDPACAHSPGGRTDLNCNGSTDVLDVVELVGAAFRNEPPVSCDPCACTPYPTNCP